MRRKGLAIRPKTCYCDENKRSFCLFFPRVLAGKQTVRFSALCYPAGGAGGATKTKHKT